MPVISNNDFEKRFTYQIPTPDTQPVFAEIREVGKGFADMINTKCPDSREALKAIERIEEAIMWANASVARHGLPRKEVTNGKC